MSAKTALITGASGQDGTLLSEWLTGLGYRVVGIVREGAQAQVMAASGATLLCADLCDPIAMRAVLERWQPDEIYHLAAYHHSSQETEVNSELSAMQGMMATNFTATQALAFAVLASGAKPSLVFAGSSQMYTAAGEDHLVCELTPRRPSTFYGRLKSWSAELLAQLREDFGLRAGTAILFNHESPLRRSQFVSRKITQAAAAIRLGQSGRLEVLNTRARADWCGAADVVRALHLMASAPAARDYVVASGTLHTVEDLLTIAFGHCGLDWREHVVALEAREQPALCGDPGLIESELGWRRSMSFDDLIRNMVDHDLWLLGAGARSV
jgi:GDPmannose 4,6-dehydratase